MNRSLLDPLSPFAIGVDVGGTKINAGVISSKGDVLHSFSLSTLAGEVSTALRIQEAVQGLLTEALQHRPDLRIKGIGVGTAGQVDRNDGSIRFSSDLIPGYMGTPLKKLLEDRFQLPVEVDNDVNVLALTEKKLGAGKNIQNMICLAVGTGVGGAILVNGRLVHGAWGGAGELGHMSVDFKGETCICGGIGCLEHYASGTSIARRMRERLAAGGTPEESIDTREVIARWYGGDPVATEIMQDALAALGSAIATLIHTFNTELIVIGGGVAEAGEALFEGLRQEVDKRTMSSLRQGVEIRPAYRGNWGGMIGAALQIWEYNE
ncbi:ROK family protein [Paenibacillus silviterrae]|uniref:ROK family protein n=1 Tax=Paenibacillus silviterrae TaxID=3242194 RepID=UPI002543A876|nr:ROK family protein [Paenibacillus chinjuensis]